jgi:hypothetical protein
LKVQTQDASKVPPAYGLQTLGAILTTKILMTKRQLLIFFVSGLVFQSCGFFFYNYRCTYDCDFTIPNKNADTNLRYAIGKYIDNISNNHSFYSNFATPTYDSLSLYGPDYHTLTFKIKEINNATNIHFHYFAYNGSRKRPPHKLFIQNLTDTLKIKFGATQTINYDHNNERKK